MPPLRRHQLAHLHPAGWQQLLAHDWDDDARACLHHWAGQRLPLVVTRQPLTHQAAGGPVALGLTTPLCWGRRPLALQVDRAHLAWLSEFPQLGQALGALPRAGRAPLQALVPTLQRLGVRAHVYGSAGWQGLTGLGYLHARSDLDLWLPVEAPSQADAVAAALAQCPSAARLDGELVWPDGSAVAWREWALWRDGRCSQVLVKRLHGAALETDPAALASAWPCSA